MYYKRLGILQLPHSLRGLYFPSSICIEQTLSEYMIIVEFHLPLWKNLISGQRKREDIMNKLARNMYYV